MEELPNSSTLEGQENSQTESHNPQYGDSDHENINNHKQDNAKEENTAEMEDDDDEDMDDSINQDNDDNEDDEEEYLEGHEHDKNGNSSNPGSPKMGKRITSGALSGEQSVSNISSRSHRRKNKRKNFKPRNILYGGNDEDMEEDVKENANEDQTEENSNNYSDQGPLNLSGHNGNAINNRMLYPRKMLEQQLLGYQKGDSEQVSSSPNTASSPMDLSNYQANDIERDRNQSGSNGDQNSNPEEDDEMRNGCEEESKRAAAVAAKGLSVVRPEVLFGENNSNSVTSGSPTSSPGLSLPPTSHSSPFGVGSLPPSLMPFLGIPGATSKSASPASGLPSSDAMKEAFQEVLKLYGVPSELAEAIAKNAQNNQGKFSMALVVKPGEFVNNEM